MDALSLFCAAGSAVLNVVLACAAGAWLARREVLHREAVSDLTQVVFKLMLPCLLLSKISVSFTAKEVVSWWILPVMAVVYNVIGLSIGVGIRHALRVEGELREVLVAASGFANSGYLPMTLVAVVCTSAPWFEDGTQAAARAIAYISVYLIAQSPFLWGWGFPYLGGGTSGRPALNRILSPPVYGLAIGVSIAVVPPVNALFYGTPAPLRAVMSAVELLGSGTLPCAMLIIGANLARCRLGGSVRPAVIAGVVTGRLLIMPVIGILLTSALYRFGVVPDDPLFRLVLMLEAATPSAANLVLMCQLHRRGEAAMSTLVFWEYILATVTLTLFLSVQLYLVFG